MEMFGDDKLYDIDPADDLKDFWDTELDPTMQDVLRLNSSGGISNEWIYIDKDLPGVIIHDKLMTDAALGTRPIKTEHSYSLASDGDSLPESPGPHNRLDEMEEDCFPVMMNTKEEQMCTEEIEVKEEPLSETESLHSSCPSSPRFINTNELHFEPEIKQTIVKQGNIIIGTPGCLLSQRIPLGKVNIKLEPNTTTSTTTNAFHLPPTPPSCSSSEDSEDNTTISQPPSPNVRKTLATATNARLLTTSHHHHQTTRQPIHTPLISTQPKGSTGTLLLTEEEKRTLIAEGYPVPTRLPLTKSEEKSLKKIRRKIKNKISAQESRRKKKEYMDQLERKVEVLVTENNEYRSKIENLQDSNSNLMIQLQKLQAIVARTHPQIIKQLK